MSTDIDPERLVREDEAFRAYAGTAALEFLLSDKREARDFIAMVYSMYVIGMTEKQLKTYVRTLNGFYD